MVKVAKTRIINSFMLKTEPFLVKAIIIYENGWLVKPIRLPMITLNVIEVHFV